MADQSFANRRIILRKVQGLVNELIQVNEAAYRVAQTCINGGVLADAEEKVEPMLATCGLATGVAGTTDTISDVIVAILYGALTDVTVGAPLSWTWDPDSE